MGGRVGEQKKKDYRNIKMVSDKSRVYNSDTSNRVLWYTISAQYVEARGFSQFELVLVTKRVPDQLGQQSETCSQIDKQMKKKYKNIPILTRKLMF